MRRVSRTYAFDLQLPGPSRSVEPIGSFEPVHLDDLDYQGHTTGFSVSVEANGSVSSPEDKEPNGEVEASQSNGLQTPPAPESGPTAETEPTQDQPDQDQPDQDRPDQDQPDLEDLSSSPVLFIEESEEEMNSNNNNQLSLSGPFEEINLDETRSSVQPFGFSSAELQPFY
ncbi:hypothetical protein NL108_018245 [Boleophthalmus pectinirostris]|nr:hypothetical protein NL108_018245 [Boleophthalmus pectinirostris]